ncbi:hypothetical protein ACLB2K_055899 [Fragaria x ananassa]
MYFFSPRDKKYPNGKLPSRTTGGGNGFWKATGKDKEIFNERKQLIGSRKTLIFYEGKPKHGEKKTDWIMQEYKMQESLAPTSSTTRAPDDNRLDDLVLCKVYPSKMSKPNPNTLHAKKTEMSDSVPLEQDLPVLERSAVTTNLGELVHVTNLGARSHAHHQQNLSLIPISSQLPVIDSVSTAISSLAGNMMVQIDLKSVASAIASLASGLVFPDMALQQPSLDNGCLPLRYRSVITIMMIGIMVPSDDMPVEFRLYMYISSSCLLRKY